jgi:hypothetical protein
MDPHNMEYAKLQCLFCFYSMMIILLGAIVQIKPWSSINIDFVNIIQTGSRNPELGDQKIIGPQPSWDNTKMQTSVLIWDLNVQS